MNGWWRASGRARVQSNLYDLVSLMTIDLRVSDGSPKQFSLAGVVAHLQR